jgi:cytochrome b561
MTFRNTTREWGALSKALHWIIVLLIIIQWIIAQRADALPLGPTKVEVLGYHKSFGMTVLMLAVLRLAWRWMNPVPTLAGVTKGWERALAHVSHFLLYALLFAMPLSGWMMSSAASFRVSYFKLFTWPDLVQPGQELFRQLQDLHHLLFNVLVVVALLHIAGALKHAVIDKNDVLKRMLPFGGGR